MLVDEVRVALGLVAEAILARVHPIHKAANVVLQAKDKHHAVADSVAYFGQPAALLSLQGHGLAVGVAHVGDT